MDKRECRVGMVVMFKDNVAGEAKGVVIKINPKRAKVRALDVTRSQRRVFQPGIIWGISYSLLRPAGEGPEVLNEMGMRSFADTKNPAYKEYFANQEKADRRVENLQGSSVAVMEAICSVYEDMKLEWERCKGVRGPVLVKRLNFLFGALGREVSEKAADEWRKHAGSSV